MASIQDCSPFPRVTFLKDMPSPKPRHFVGFMHIRPFCDKLSQFTSLRQDNCTVLVITTFYLYLLRHLYRNSILLSQ